MKTIIGKVSGKPIELYTADEVFADIRSRPDYAETRARIEAEMEAEQAFWAKAKAALRKCGITGKLAEDILDRFRKNIRAIAHTAGIAWGHDIFRHYRGLVPPPWLRPNLLRHHPRYLTTF